MKADIVATVRRTSLVSTFGVGSLLPAQDDSVMICGLEDWPDGGDVITEPRLARSLGVREFRSPPTWRKTDGDVPAVRFPQWSFCTHCRRLAPFWNLSDGGTTSCVHCSNPLSPSRFVSCCTNGHIEDFPYSAWVHKNASLPHAGHSLKLTARGHTSALSDLVIECSCGESRSMEGAFAKAALQGIKRCTGSRPWLTASEPDCDQPLRTLQRGSANVWFAVTRSAISIPSVSSIADTFIEPRMRDVKPDATPEAIADTLNPPTGCTTQDLIHSIERWRNPAVTPATATDDELRAEEYTALVRGRGPVDDQAQFLCQEVDLAGSSLPPLVVQVSRVSRLREVRALTGFTRIEPPMSDKDVAVAPLTEKTDPSWLPAVEVLGEGVFLRLDDDLLERWCATDFARSRTRDLTRSMTARAKQGQSSMLGETTISPRTLVLHSLAHVLLDEMSLTSGYPSSSLRERVYDKPEQAGILIYTATADGAGSLGGLAALSDRHRIAATLANGIERARWCTTDPVCIESTESGVDGMNHAACHGCLLVPETSCERFNLLLDRATLVGIPGADDDAGLFR